MPGTRMRLAVTMTNQRKARCSLWRAILVKVMAKATLAQLVATVVMVMDVLWRRKKYILVASGLSSVAEPRAMIRLMRAPPTKRRIHDRLSTPSSHQTLEKWCRQPRRTKRKAHETPTSTQMAVLAWAACSPRGRLSGSMVLLRFKWSRSRVARDESDGQRRGRGRAWVIYRIDISEHGIGCELPKGAGAGAESGVQERGQGMMCRER